MSEGPTLYPTALLEHAKRPRGAGRLETPTHVGRVDNPLCGDRVRIEVEVEDERIKQVAHQTRGCALCLASASLLADAILGVSVGEVQATASKVRPDLEAMIRGDDPPAKVVSPLFAGVAQAPARLECVVLPWAALQRALSPEGDTD